MPRLSSRILPDGSFKQGFRPHSCTSPVCGQSLAVFGCPWPCGYPPNLLCTKFRHSNSRKFLIPHSPVSTMSCTVLRPVQYSQPSTTLTNPQQTSPVDNLEQHPLDPICCHERQVLKYQCKIWYKYPKFGTRTSIDCECWFLFPMGLWLVALISWRLLDTMEICQES